MKELKTLVIDRNVWLRGRDAYATSALLREDGKRCCVGIYLQSCGIEDDRLLKKDFAHSLPENELPEEARWLVSVEEFEDEHLNYDSSEDGSTLYSTNDSMELSEKMREYLVKRKFRKHGIKVEFIN